MTRPELSSRRRQLDPEAEARIAAFSSTPNTAPEVATVPPAPVVPAAAPQAEEAKSKGFNYRMTPTRHATLDALRKEDDRSFQWMLDKLIDLGMEAWKNGDRPEK